MKMKLLPHLTFNLIFYYAFNIIFELFIDILVLKKNVLKV